MKKHLLHIGKTGGTALLQALMPVADRAGIVFHDHDFRLMDVPLGEQAIFVVRDPVSRFVSGFNSRLRRGRPRHHVEWTAAERTAFLRFACPAALAAALLGENEQDREAASTAMRAIYHTARHLTFWLDSIDYLASRRDDVFFIAETASLGRDFVCLAQMLGLPSDVVLPTDPVGMHATPAGFDTSLSPEQARAIEAWYRDDVPLYQLCLRLRAQTIAARQPGS